MCQRSELLLVGPTSTFTMSHISRSFPYIRRYQGSKQVAKQCRLVEFSDDPMTHQKPTRVPMPNRPLLMRKAVLAVISDQPDSEVVDGVSAVDNLNRAIDQIRPDVPVLALDEQNEILSQGGFFGGRHPETRILAIDPERNRSTMYRAVVDIRNKPVERSPAGPLTAIRERGQASLAFGVYSGKGCRHDW
jgi:hypothetical protein